MTKSTANHAYCHKEHYEDHQTKHRFNHLCEPTLQTVRIRKYSKDLLLGPLSALNEAPVQINTRKPSTQLSRTSI